MLGIDKPHHCMNPSLVELFFDELDPGTLTFVRPANEMKRGPSEQHSRGLQLRGAFERRSIHQGPINNAPPGATLFVMQQAGELDSVKAQPGPMLGFSISKTAPSPQSLIPAAVPWQRKCSLPFDQHFP